VNFASIIRTGQKQFTKKSIRPHISKDFRKKVSLALEQKNPNGSYHEVHLGFLGCDISARLFGYGIEAPGGGALPSGWGNNQQFVFRNAFSDFWNFDSFTFQELMVSLARTWYDYPKDESWTSVNTMAVDQEYRTMTNYARSANGNSDIEFFNDQLLQMKAKIVSCKATYKIKNNSNRKYNIVFYTCSPKKMLNGEQTALKVFKDSLANDASFGNSNNASNNININAVDINTLHVTPGITSEFGNYYAVEKKHIKCEAGQDFSFTVPGPSNVDFAPNRWRMMEKAYMTNSAPLPDNVNLGGTNHFQYKPGFSKSCFMVIIPEMLPYGNRQAAHLFDFDNIVDNTEYGFTVEKINDIKWDMPDTVGFRKALRADVIVDPGPGPDFISTILNPTLNNRRRRYWHKVWTNATVVNDGGNVIKRVDPRDPGIVQDIVG
jgi:hypothetical protein